MFGLSLLFRRGAPLFVRVLFVVGPVLPPVRPRGGRVGFLPASGFSAPFLVGFFLCLLLLSLLFVLRLLFLVAFLLSLRSVLVWLRCLRLPLFPCWVVRLCRSSLFRASVLGLVFLVFGSLGLVRCLVVRALLLLFLPAFLVVRVLLPPVRSLLPSVLLLPLVLRSSWLALLVLVVRSALGSSVPCRPFLSVLRLLLLRLTPWLPSEPLLWAFSFCSFPSGGGSGGALMFLTSLERRSL